jgi:hypothetical protein
MMPALIPMRGQAGPQITLAATSTATSATAPATAPRHGTRRGRRRGQRSASAAVPSSPRASARSTHAPDRPCPSADEVHAVTLAHRDPAEPEASREPIARRHLGDQPVPRDDRLVRVPGVVVPDGVGGEREGGGEPGGRRGQRERP